MPTADQVFVEIRATVDQHIAATKRVADATQRDMARVEGSVTGAAKAEVAAFDQVAQGAERSAQRVAAAGRAAAGAGRPSGAGGIQNTANQLQDFIVQVSSGTSVLRAFGQQAPQLLSGFGPWGAVLGIAAAGVGVLATALGGFEDAADRAKEAQKAFDIAMKDSKGSLTASEQAAVEYASSLSLVERGLLNVARQEIDSAIRKQKDALKALTDDAKDAAANLKAAFEAQQIDVGGTNTIPSAQLERFNKAVADLNATANPTSAQLNAVLGIVREISPQFAALGLNVDKTATSLGEAGKQASTMEANAASAAKVQERLNEVNTLAADILRTFGFSAAAAAGHVDTLTGSLGGYIAQLTRALSLSGSAPGAINGVVAQLRQDNQQMGDTVKSQKDYAENQAAINVAQSAWSEELKNTSNPFKALLAYGEAYRRQTENNRKREAAAKLGTTTAEQDLANLKAQAAALDGSKEAQKKVQAEQRATAAANAAFSKALAETGDQTKAAEIKSATYAAQLAIETKNQQASAGAAKLSAAAKREIRTDDAILHLEQELDLNQRLIAVYREGPEALARAKAGYDALNSARQLGYKVGTAEHAQYVQRYQDIAEQKRQSDVILADFAKADGLTKSVMTSQETYNTTLAEYNRLRDEGTLKEEAYLRLVRDLNAQNSGYAEGIQAIGQAITGGIQGATSFNDALVKIGLSLAQLLIQAAAFGTGPLGKLFDSLAGTSGGLFNLTGAITGSLGAGPNVSGLVPSQSTLPHLAGGGQATPGNIYQVGETGREWFAPTVPGQVISNSVIKNAARGGGGGSAQPIVFNINMAGANGDRAIAEIAARAVKTGLAGVPEINRQHQIRFAS